jgi:outer membrane protein OmpA-like peptidoglycan-associated protein
MLILFMVPTNRRFSFVRNNEMFRKQASQLLKCKKILYLSLVLFVLPFSIQSSNFGSNTAEFLKINPEAGPAGMGETNIAIAEGTNSLQYNPAGMAILDRGEVTATQILWFDSINMTHVAFGYPVDYGFGIGGSILWINFGSFDSTGGAADAVSVQNGVLNFGVGKSIGENVHLGMNLRGLYEHFSAGSAVSESSLGLSADAGAVFYLGSRNVTLGITAKNMGLLFGISDPLPVEAGIGLGYRIFNGSFDIFNVALDFTKTLNTDNYFVGLGVEGYVFKAVALRMGLRYNNAFEMDTLNFSNIQRMLILSAGAGIDINDTFAVDYAYTPMGDLGQVQRLTLKIKFGDSWYDRRMAEKKVSAEPKTMENPKVSIADGEIKSVSFQPNAPQQGVKEWTLAIKTSDGKIVKSFSGVGEVPKTLNWDGTDTYGKISKADANYVFDFKAKNDNGQVTNSTGQLIEPKHSDFITTQDRRFIPEKGMEILVAPVLMLVSSDIEERRTVPFVMTGKNIKNVKSWEFAVYDKNKTLLKKFGDKSALPSYLVWDGKDEYGNYAADIKSCDYILTLTGADGKKTEIRDRQLMRDTFTISTTGTKLKMAQRIYFETNSSAVPSGMMTTLDSIAAEIKGYKSSQIYIQGHSSSEGDENYNLKLSQDRAKSVLRYLVEKYKVSPLSITTAGYGSAVPLSRGNTEQDKMRNRRVEIIIIGEK